MPTTNIDIKALPEQFAEVLALAATGTEVIVTENDVPRAKLVPLRGPSGIIPILGLHPGSMIMAPDFDEPLTEEEWGGDM